MAEPTVYVVDDDPSVRNSVRSLISSVGLPVKTFHNGGEFLGQFDPDAPGCLVLDIRMPEMSGLQVQKKLADQGCQIPIIIVTAYGDVPIAVNAMRAGAVVVIEKPYPPQQLLDNVQVALDRDRDTRRRSLERLKMRTRFETLSPREREVLHLLLDGLSSREVANRLGLSPKTIHVHRSSVLDKMKAGSDAELARFVITAGLSETR